MKLTIKYSLQKDIENYLKTVYSFEFERHGRKNIENQLLSNFPEEFQKALRNAKNKTEAREIIANYIKENFAYRKDLHKKISNDLKKAWNENESQITSKLEKAYGKKFPFKSITVYLTSNKRCPYNYKDRWIMVYAKASIETKLEILLHELNHFMFYYYISGNKLGLNNKQYESLKESLTILTNSNEPGYPAHEKLRAWLKTQRGTIPEILKNEGWRKLL